MNRLKIKLNPQTAETGIPASVVDKLVSLGKAGTNMELVGTINIVGGLKKSKKDYMDLHYGSLNLDLSEYLTINAPKIYLDFVDPGVESIMMTVASSDGIGITIEDAAALLNNLFPSFANNTTINSFNELKEFTNVNTIVSNFNGCTNLTSIDLSNILYIGNLAFTNSGISGVINLPKFIKFNYSFPMQPFNNCNNITEINFGPYIDVANGISTDSTLTNLTNLTKVTGLSNITNIGGGTFSGDINLEFIDLDFSKLSVLNNALFKDCKKLFTNLDLSPCISITSVGNDTFYGCTSLYSITLPPNLTKILGSAFYGCTSLESISIPNSVYEILGAAFYNCSSLQSITLPTSLSIIDTQCFFGCTSLTSLVIPESVSEIKNLAFKNCTSLTSITFPTTIPLMIRELCFSECRSLTSLTLPSNVTGSDHWLLPTGIKYLSLVISLSTCALQQLNINTTDFDVLLLGQNANLPNLELTVPDCVTSIECTGATIKKLTFSTNSNLQYFCSISDYKNVALYDWDNFVSSDKGKISSSRLSNILDIVNLPAIKVIPEYYFEGCNKSYITSSFINNAISNAVVIGRYAFRGLNPTLTIGDIIIPSTVKFIGSGAFLTDHKITSLTFQSNTPPEVESSTFFYWGYGNSAIGGLKIYVPDAVVSDYKVAWPEYSNNIYPVSSKT